MSVPIKQTITGKVYSVTVANTVTVACIKNITVVNDYSNIIDK
jgi:hypothetical protein